MKKTKILSLVLILAICLSAFIACGGAGGDGEAYIVIERIESGTPVFDLYRIELSSVENRTDGALGLIEYLAAISTFKYTLNTSGGYGAYVEAIGGLKPNALENEYIAIYTSESLDFAVPTAYYPEVATVDYDHNTLTLSGVGISSMTVNDGTIILFRIERY